MKQNVFQSEGAKADMSKRSRKLKSKQYILFGSKEGEKDTLDRQKSRLEEMEELMDRLHIPQEKRKQMIRKLEKIEAERWEIYIEKMARNLKMNILQKKKIIESQTPDLFIEK